MYWSARIEREYVLILVLVNVFYPRRDGTIRSRDDRRDGTVRSPTMQSTSVSPSRGEEASSPRLIKELSKLTQCSSGEMLAAAASPCDGRFTPCLVIES